MQKESQTYKIAPAERLASVSEYYFSKKLKEVEQMNAEGKDAYLVANPDEPLKAAAAAVCAMGLAGEIGWSHMKPEDGNSTYRNRIIDAICHMDGETLEKGAEYEVR